MFSKKKTASVELTKLSSLIANNVETRGDLTFVDGLKIDGQIHGNVEARDGAKSLLVLSVEGSIHGNVRSYDAIIDGEVNGDLVVDHFLELQANARVRGNITYRQLRMDVGATVEGKLSKFGEHEAPSNVVELGAVAAV